MFKFSMPKYMEFAPEFRAAAKDSREPTGAIISKSSLFITLIEFVYAKLLNFSSEYATLLAELALGKSFMFGS